MPRVKRYKNKKPSAVSSAPSLNIEVEVQSQQLGEGQQHQVGVEDQQH